MKQFSTVVFLALVFCSPTLAEDADTIVYLPAKDGKPAQTIKLPTGDPQAVIESNKGDRPEQCPTDAFWAYAGSPGELVNCGEGSVYEIQPYETPTDSNYTMRLVQSSEPKPGTNDPGSSKKTGEPPEVTP